MMRFSLALALMFLPAVSAPAQEHKAPWVSAARCSPQDADKAEHQADALKSWTVVYRAFKQYGQCDDGAVAEGYSASVVSLLADRWPTVRELSALEARDPMLGRFVLWHVDETASPAQLKAIRTNARDHCPAGFETLCKRIEKAAMNP